MSGRRPLAFTKWLTLVKVTVIANTDHFMHLERSERGRNVLLKEVVAFLQKSTGS